VPPAIGQGIILEVPTLPDGTSLSFTITRAIARLEASAAADTSFLLQKASGGDVAFASPATITTVTVAATHYRGTQTGLSYAVNSGDLIGLYFSAIGTGSEPPFSVYLEGSS
jgi:hypothetical protein